MFSSTTNPAGVCSSSYFNLAVLMREVHGNNSDNFSVITIIIYPVGDPHLVHEFLLFLANCVPTIFRCDEAMWSKRCYRY